MKNSDSNFDKIRKDVNAGKASADKTDKKTKPQANTFRPKEEKESEEDDFFNENKQNKTIPPKNIDKSRTF
jgi:hypothetical protein